MSYFLTVVKTDGNGQVWIDRKEVIDIVASSDGYSYEDLGDYLNIKITDSAGKSFYCAYRNGEVFAKNPEPEHIGYLIEFAKKLGGRVRGDQLETYKSAYETYAHPDDDLLSRRAKELSRATKINRKRRQILINGLIFLVFTILAVFVGFLEDG